MDFPLVPTHLTYEVPPIKGEKKFRAFTNKSNRAEVSINRCVFAVEPATTNSTATYNAYLFFRTVLQKNTLLKYFETIGIFFNSGSRLRLTLLTYQTENLETYLVFINIIRSSNTFDPDSQDILNRFITKICPEFEYPLQPSLLECSAKTNRTPVKDVMKDNYFSLHFQDKEHPPTTIVRCVQKMTLTFDRTLKQIRAELTPNSPRDIRRLYIYMCRIFNQTYFTNISVRVVISDKLELTRFLQELKSSLFDYDRSLKSLKESQCAEEFFVKKRVEYLNCVELTNAKSMLEFLSEVKV
jgi:hypothetical protein